MRNQFSRLWCMQKCLTHPNGHFFIPLPLLSQPLESPLTTLPPTRIRCGRVPQTAKPSANWRTKRVRGACAKMPEHKTINSSPHEHTQQSIAHHPHGAPCPMHAHAQNHTMILEPATHNGHSGHTLECLLGFGMRTAANKPNHGHIPNADACQLGKCARLVAIFRRCMASHPSTPTPVPCGQTIPMSGAAERPGKTTEQKCQ